MALILPYILGTSVLLTLLIACANVAILLIAQWTTREHEIAIRASIGASRGRIVRTLLTESVLIATAAAMLGVCVTLVLRAWVLRSGGGASDDMFFNLAIDARVFLQAAGIALVTGILTGIAPALYETQRLHGNPMRAIAASDRVRQRWRHALVVLEITITVALLVETAAMIDGYLRARSAQLGYATAPLMSARLDNAAGVPAADTLDLVTHIPGVASAALSTTVPYATIGPQQRVGTDADLSNAVTAERAAITPTYFTTLGVPMRTGRPFLDEDLDAPRTAIVNEALARRLSLGSDPIGRRIWIGQNVHDVIGVVADYSTNVLRPRESESKVFVPMPRTKGPARVHLLVRAEGDPAPLTQTIRREVRDAPTGTIVASAYTVDQILGVMGQELLLGTAPLFPLIVIGILLTTAGIYGTLGSRLRGGPGSSPCARLWVPADAISCGSFRCRRSGSSRWGRRLESRRRSASRASSARAAVPAPSSTRQRQPSSSPSSSSSPSASSPRGCHPAARSRSIRQPCCEQPSGALLPCLIVGAPNPGDDRRIHL